MQFLNKVKRAVRAFNNDEEVVTYIPPLQAGEIDPEALRKFLREEPLGDGGAVFLGEGTHEEYIDQMREDDGTKPWYQRLLRL